MLEVRKPPDMVAVPGGHASLDTGLAPATPSSIVNQALAVAPSGESGLTLHLHDVTALVEVTERDGYSEVRIRKREPEGHKGKM